MLPFQVTRLVSLVVSRRHDVGKAYDSRKISKLSDCFYYLKSALYYVARRTALYIQSISLSYCWYTINIQSLVFFCVGGETLDFPHLRIPEPQACPTPVRTCVHFRCLHQADTGPFLLAAVVVPHFAVDAIGNAVECATAEVAVHSAVRTWGRLQIRELTALSKRLVCI